MSSAIPWIVKNGKDDASEKSLFGHASFTEIKLRTVRSI